MFLCTYYAQNYASIIGWCLPRSTHHLFEIKIDISLVLKLPATIGILSKETEVEEFVHAADKYVIFLQSTKLGFMSKVISITT